MYQQYGAPSMRQEIPLLSEYGVQVTSARFVVYHQTYPLGGITSVAPFSIPASRGGPFLMIIIGLPFLLGGLVGLGWNGEPQAIVTLLIGLGLVVGGVLLFRSRKPTYGVIIMTSGMNVRALASTDGAFVQRVIGALNHALASR